MTEEFKDAKKEIKPSKQEVVEELKDMIEERCLGSDDDYSVEDWLQHAIDYLNED